ncbi:hypothetical protein E4582_12270 [Luteimonas yindakuii]|uniref:Uncharacterized protein n=1 Tax=Luteimonas yindakuii TaxID=2565782 RepID=A0A4Z1RFW4_9GAMM|nr:hypothetical protein [Luteimonas yindakuii]QCO66899.1 hypothetical protein E5843_02205 [Luteimonas yindakuii]TKS52979.1 hypothetical protein E4582_12270 [Luteimonas yindakuii]
MSAGGGQPGDLRRLPGAELERRYAQLHRDVFALYEEAEATSDASPRERDAAHARAQARAQPLIEQARRLHDERVRRLRVRARRWWWATGIVAVAGGALVLWLLARG